MTDKQRRKAWKEYDRKQAAAENRWVKPITAALQSQIRAFNTFALDQGLASAIVQIDVIVKPDAIEAVLADLCRKEGVRYANTQFRSLEALYGAERDKQKAFGTNLNWLRKIRDYISEFLGNKVVKITDTTKNHIRNVVDKGLTAGDGIAEITQELITDGVSVARSHVIARTETAGVMNAANSAAIGELGLLMEDIWTTARDERVRSLHVIMEGERIVHGGMFSNGLRYPADPAGAAEQVIMCRCCAVQEPVRDANGRLIETPVRK